MWSSHLIPSSNILNPQFHRLHIVFHLHSMDSWPFYHSRWRSSRQSSQRSHHHCHRQFFLFLYPVPFKLLTIQFVTLHQHTNGLLLYINIGFPWCKRDRQQKGCCSPCSSMIRPSPFSQAIPPQTWSFTKSDLSELPSRRTRSPSLALWMSGFDDHKTTSVWVQSRVLRVTCHSTWGCSGVRKEDPGQPWRLT